MGRGPEASCQKHWLLAGPFHNSSQPGMRKAAGWMEKELLVGIFLKAWRQRGHCLDGKTIPKGVTVLLSYIHVRYESNCNHPPL
jgi:hypothetical protein